jgi:hypothetical protein
LASRLLFLGAQDRERGGNLEKDYFRREIISIKIFHIVKKQILSG